MAYPTSTHDNPEAVAPELITPDLVALDAAFGTTPSAVIAALADRLELAGRAEDAMTLRDGALAREAQSATGLPGGIAIPHCRSATVTVPSLAFVRLSPKVDFGAPDGPADLVFLIAAPEGAGTEHMKLLSGLARALVRPDFVAALRAATTAQDVVALVDNALSPTPEPTSKPAPENDNYARHLVAVTACPTGIAHTYMAADALVAAGERAGVTVHVETQGSSGSTPLDPQLITSAAAVIFATDVGVRARERFVGKPVVTSGVKRAINEPDTMIVEALRAGLNPNAATVAATSTGAESIGDTTDSLGWGTRLRQILLTGVSYMIPFVAAGGLLIALGFLLGGYQIADHAKDIALHNSLTQLPREGLNGYLGAVLFELGSLAFGFLVPALAGYIAYSIADRPGLAPGFTAGAVAVFVGAGFLGGLIGGLIAGFAALWISRIPMPQAARGLMPVAIIPLLATFFVGAVMLMLLGKPLAAVTSGLTHWLNSLSGSSAVLLGVVLGLMMCFDLGGPVNKAAYSFAVAGLSVSDTGSLRIMATVMAAGMVPPLAMALSTTLWPRLYSSAERENGKAAILLGAAFISEGAIPFAAADPLRVIPAMMAGGATTGALIMATQTTLRAPHGGIFVFFAVGHLVWFLLALVAGTAVGAACVTAAKQFTTPRSTVTARGE